MLVTGAGIIGNLWVTMFHHHGVRNVTVSEPALGRRKITEHLGKDRLDTGLVVVVRLSDTACNDLHLISLVLSSTFVF